MSVLVSEIIETAQSLWQDEPAKDLYLRIAATGDRKQIQEEIDRILEQRQRRLKKSKLFSSELRAQERAAIPHRGRSGKWGVSARRLRTWDLKQSIPSVTFEKIGKKVFRKVSNSDPVAAAKMAYDDFKAAEEMIKAAEIGKLQPSFRKRHPVNPPTVDIPVLSVPHFSAIPDFALVDHKLAIKRQSSS